MIKSNGCLEAFDEEKLRAGVLRALVKRPFSHEAFESLLQRIMMSVHQVGEREILGKNIGEMVMKELAKVDMVAYVRYASVYQSFQDLHSFQVCIMNHYILKSHFFKHSGWFSPNRDAAGKLLQHKDAFQALNMTSAGDEHILSILKRDAYKSNTPLTNQQVTYVTWNESQKQEWENYCCRNNS